MQLRGGNAATVRDVGHLRKLIVQDVFTKLADLEDHLIDALEDGLRVPGNPRAAWAEETKACKARKR